MRILAQTVRITIVLALGTVACLSEETGTPMRHRALDTTEMPAFMVSGAGYASVFLSPGYSAMYPDEVKAVAGLGRGLNGMVAVNAGRSTYLGMMVDYLWASFQNGLGHDGAMWTGTGAFWSVGPSLSFDAGGAWFNASLSYLRQLYDWDSRRGYRPDFIPAETREGMRVQGHVVVPVTTIIGIHGGVRVDVAGAVQPNFMLGVSFCNIMDLLYLDRR